MAYMQLNNIKQLLKNTIVYCIYEQIKYDGEFLQHACCVQAEIRPDTCRKVIQFVRNKGCKENVGNS